MQGSGWGWLGYSPELKRLVITTTANQDPLTTQASHLFMQLNSFWHIDTNTRQAVLYRHANCLCYKGSNVTRAVKPVVSAMHSWTLPPKGLQDAPARQGKAPSLPNHYERPQSLPWLNTRHAYLNHWRRSTSCLVPCFLTLFLHFFTIASLAPERCP